MILDMLDHRQEIVQSALSDPNALCGLGPQTNGILGNEELRERVRLKAAQQGPGVGISVMSANEKRALKELRREEKKQLRKDPFSKPDVDLQKKKYQEEQSAPLIRHSGSSGARYPFVFDQVLERKNISAFVAGTKILLPENARKEQHQKYDEVTIPPTEVKPPNLSDLVDVGGLDELGRLCFQGFKRLNRIQSVVFDTAYNTSENLLVSAPTGAGKTNIALLTVIQTIKMHVENNVIKKDSFKIVYVAPMKALAAEMTKSFGKRLEPLGITVRELTGDMQLTKKEISMTQVRTNP